MFISDIKYVDLKRSKIDEEKSGEKVGKYGRKGGDYKFINKEYVDYKNATVRPEWYLSWNRNNDREIRGWMAKWKFEFVTVNDPFWPEPLAPDASGQYIFGDSILMKCPLTEWVEKRKREMARSDKAFASKLKEFEATLKRATKEGVKVENEFINRIFGT